MCIHGINYIHEWIEHLHVMVHEVWMMVLVHNGRHVQWCYMRARWHECRSSIWMGLASLLGAHFALKIWEQVKIHCKKYLPNGNELFTPTWGIMHTHHTKMKSIFIKSIHAPCPLFGTPIIGFRKINGKCAYVVQNIAYCVYLIVGNFHGIQMLFCTIFSWFVCLIFCSVRFTQENTPIITYVLCVKFFVLIDWKWKQWNLDPTNISRYNMVLRTGTSIVFMYGEIVMSL